MAGYSGGGPLYEQLMTVWSLATTTQPIFAREQRDLSAIVSAIVNQTSSQDGRATSVVILGPVGLGRIDWFLSSISGHALVIFLTVSSKSILCYQDFLTRDKDQDSAVEPRKFRCIFVERNR